MLKVRLFGSGQAQYYDRYLSGFPNKQCCLILCYLLLNREQPHHREKLASVFWSDFPTTISRKNLRNNLWRLRQVLQSAGAPPEDYLMMYEDSILFLSSSPYWLDIEIFEKTSLEVHEIEGYNLSIEDAEKLERANNLYIGDLMESNYDDWCLYDRERFRLLYTSNLSKLMDYYTQRGCFELGIEYGNRLLEIDQTHEKIHRYMMRLYLQAGNRRAAINQYQRCCQIMRDEFGISPMEETHRLFKNLQSGKPIAVNEPLVDNKYYEKHENRKKLTKPVAQDVFKKLKQLQETIEETRNELHHLEQLLDEALREPDSP